MSEESKPVIEPLTTGWLPNPHYPECEEYVDHNGNHIARIEDFGYAAYPSALNAATGNWERNGPTQDRVAGKLWAEPWQASIPSNPAMSARRFTIPGWTGNDAFAALLTHLFKSRLCHVEFVLHLGDRILELLFGGIIQFFRPQATKLPAWNVALMPDQMQAMNTRPLFEFSSQFIFDQNWLHRMFSGENTVSDTTYLQRQRSCDDEPMR